MRRGWFLPAAAMLGFAFLYAPIISLVVFSFNESKLVTVWSGFSTKWYGELFADPQMLDAAWLSLQHRRRQRHHRAWYSGTLCAIALVRFRALPRPHASGRHGVGAAGYARRHHRPVAAAALRRHGER